MKMVARISYLDKKEPRGKLRSGAVAFKNRCAASGAVLADRPTQARAHDDSQHYPG
jgi:hypothetical protein